MTLPRALNKPYYVFRPGQLLRRIARASRQPADGLETVRLPWGADIAVLPTEAVGASIVRTGVYELPATEAIWRLLDPGNLAVDVGANIGYMTNLMSFRVGVTGRIVAFEPHPELFRRLSGNARGWALHPETSSIKLNDLGVSDCTGTARLHTPGDFDSNMGTASLRPLGVPHPGLKLRGREVTVTSLDAEFPEERIGLLKVDVEGHELNVFLGADALLRQRRVRDILFEEHGALPTPVSELLESYGYRVFSFEQRLRGLIVSPAATGASGSLWDAPTYLATHEPERAVGRMRRRGWAALRSRR